MLSFPHKHNLIQQKIYRIRNIHIDKLPHRCYNQFQNTRVPSIGSRYTFVIDASSGGIPYNPINLVICPANAVQIYELPYGQSFAYAHFKLGRCPKPTGDKMPKYHKKTQYTEKENRTIYIILNPLSKEFYIGHCKSTLLKDVFKQHYYGQRNHTKDCFLKLKKQDLHPCLFKLEEIKSTKVEAFNYVIVWTKIFIESGYTNLNRGNILNYIQNLYEHNILIYNERKNRKMTEINSCESCVVQNYERHQCTLFKSIR